MELFDLKYDMHTEKQTLDAISNAITADNKNSFIRSDINVGTIVSSKDDPRIKEYINNSDIVNIDGMGAILGMKLLRKPLPERVTGADLFVRVLDLAEKKGFSVYFLGATEKVNELTYLTAKKNHPRLNVVGRHDGYFFNAIESMVGDIASCTPDILFVGIKSPEKEYFISEWSKQLNSKVLMGVGGTFDVYCGQVARAPKWVQKIGMEWFFRVVQEPRRMFKRYMHSNYSFLKMLIRELRK
tara:strand:- start:2731 stop:3456 length:726 start_codon:yes stop_codon:yes gene_type:complete